MGAIMPQQTAIAEQSGKKNLGFMFATS